VDLDLAEKIVTRGSDRKGVSRDVCI
jgi:hypothetical protein